MNILRMFDIQALHTNVRLSFLRLPMTFIQKCLSVVAGVFAFGFTIAKTFCIQKMAQI
jgi:hypothetical protein